MINPLQNARCVEYAWRQLLQRAAPQQESSLLQIPIAYAKPDEVDFNGQGIVVVPCGDGWNGLLERPDQSLDWVPTHAVLPQGVDLPFTTPIPVLFWGENCEEAGKPFAELRDDGKLVFYADIIAATFFMLSRWEETVVPARDEHNRFPAAASTAYKQGFLGRPVVDEYALILRAWLKALMPGWEPRGRQFSVQLQHCIDHVRRFRDWRITAKVLIADLIKRRSLDLARRTFIGAIHAHQDPFLKHIIELAHVSKRHGFDQTFFHFLVEEDGRYGGDYDIALPQIRECIAELRQMGFEVGLHASYETLNDPERLAWEKAVFDEVLGNGEYGGSQHFLRFQVPDTWRHWEQVGVASVSAMAYADHEGFRCGTCHPFHPFDLGRMRELDLWELPLIVMEVTLANYRGLTPEQSELRILELANRCKQVEGLFTLQWHNSSFDGAWVPWGETFNRVVHSLSMIS